MSLIPKDKGFFDLFDRQSAELVEAGRLLQKVSRDFVHLQEHAETFGELEHEADITAHEIISKLNRSFITPLEREDILALTHGIDEIVDLIEAAIGKARIYHVTEPTKHMEHMAEIIMKSTLTIQKAVRELRDPKHADRILSYCIEINRLENEGDFAFRSAIEELVTNHVDAFNFVRMKEIYEALEDAIDQCEDIANLIEGIIVKGV